MDRKTILEIIRSKGTVNHLALAKQLNTTRKQINPILDTLIAENLINVKVNGRKYFSAIGDGIKVKVSLDKNNEKSTPEKNIVHTLRSNISTKKCAISTDQGNTSAQGDVLTSKCACDILSECLTSNLNIINKKNNTPQRGVTSTLRGKKTILEQNLHISSTNNFKRKPLIDPWSDQAFEYWNSKPELMTHKKYNKTHRQSITYLDQLFDGSLFIHDNDIPKKYFRKKFTLDDFKIALDNFILAVTNHTFEPNDKEKITKYAKETRLPKWLYNPYSPYGVKSVFLKYLDSPKKAKPISKVEIKSKKMYNRFLELYAEEYFNGKIDSISITTINNLRTGINQLKDYFDGLYELAVRDIYLVERAEMLWQFCQEEIIEFRAKSLTDSWFWKKYHKWMVNLGIAENEEF